MNLLHFNFQANVSPPDRYRWLAPNGHVIAADDREVWFRHIKRFCDDNGIALAENWKAIAEDALCRVLPPGHCTYADGKQPGVFVDIRMTEDDWRRGMDVLESVVAQHVKSLFDAEATPLVDQSTAETRARICASCPANVMIRGCSACMGMANWIVKIRGNAKTESDGVLAQCGVCHCSNKAQVWVKAETLAKGVTPEMLEKFKSLPWCWKGKELSALLSTENP
jgi:hypothetical protein